MSATNPTPTPNPTVPIRSNPINSRIKRAFTLVEMLVVVGVMCLLAALLFAVIGRVQAVGRRTTCLSNVRQLGLALGLYAQDARTMYPRIDFNAAKNPNQCAPWADAVFPYVKNEAIFKCPSNPYGAYKTGCPPDDASDPEHKVSWSGSYNLNINYGFYFKDPKSGKVTQSYKPRVGMSTTRYTRPSSTILLLDGDGTFVNPGISPTNLQEQPLVDAATLEGYGVPDRHEGGANVCFADGHTKWMSTESLLKSSLWRINGPE